MTFKDPDHVSVDAEALITQLSASSQLLSDVRADVYVDVLVVCLLFAPQSVELKLFLLIQQAD